MNVLVIGSGGREHALVWKLRQSADVKKIYCAPGNAGIAQLAECVPIAANQITTLADFASSHAIDLTVVGPEDPLQKGIVDCFRSRKLCIFGPSAAAAEIETSKVFTKELLKKYGIPTAGFFIFDNSQEAIKFIRTHPDRWVIKADGLAAGKGVILPESEEEAVNAITDIMDNDRFGGAGKRIVIEERMTGEELSVFAVTDGRDCVLLPPAQDHKRAYDGNQGKNTGGMGSYAPTPQFSEAVINQIQTAIIEPTIRAMEREGRIYKGVLYCGLMLTAEGPKVVEFNCRFGDPECQALMPLIRSDLAELFWMVSRDHLSGYQLQLTEKASVCVVLASGGYPDAYEKGKIITGLETASEANGYLFHAGTEKKGNNYLTAGGRVLGVTAWDRHLKDAVRHAYTMIESIRFEGMQYRRDIAKNAITRAQ